MKRLGALVELIQSTKPGRVWSRYGTARGNVLAGGIAFVAFFSLFPLLTIGLTIFGLVLDGRTDLQLHLITTINTFFGGAKVIGFKPGEGLFTMSQLVRRSLLTFGIIGLVVLLLTGLSWIDALRQGIRAVFGRPDDGNPLLAKARDVALLVILGAVVLVSVFAGVGVTTAGGQILDWLGIGRGTLTDLALSVISNVVLLAIDTVVFLLFFRLLSGVRVPFRDLYGAAVLGGTALGVLKISGGVLLHSASRNWAVGALAVGIGLLVWLNLVSRLTLLAAAWAATTAQDAGHLPPIGSTAASAVDRGETPTEVPAIAAPTYGARAADRVTLAAGMVLGVFAVVGLRVVGQAGRVAAQALGPQAREEP